jgi:PKD domain
VICLNCGRPNPSGTALCSRCRQRRPGLERARGGVIYQRTRETARVTNRGPGILAVGVLLLAGLIFAGGTLAVFMRPGNETPSTNNVAGLPDPTSRLQIFEQETPTPTPSPTPTPTAAITPWFPSGSPPFGSLLPSSGATFPPVTPTPGTVPTPRPTKPPTPRPTATPAPRAKFSASQQGTSTSVAIDNNTIGPATDWFWDFGDGNTSNEKNPGSHDYGSYNTYTITLTVSGPGGQDMFQKQVSVQEPPPVTPSPTPPPPTDPPPTGPPQGSPQV